jgi:hypothetical protein
MKILSLKGEVSAQPTEGEALLTLPFPPPALRATSPSGGRISASQNIPKRT